MINDNIDQDIIQFLKQISTQDDNAKAETLRNLLNKYVHLNKTDFMMDKSDLNLIMSDAKSAFSTVTLPKTLASGSIKRQLTEEEQRFAIIVDSVVGYLNNKDCFKRLARFNYIKG